MQHTKSLFGCNRGIAMIEFGIILPILALLLFGTIEVSRYALINQKLDKVANAMGDFSTQGSNIRQADLDNYAAAIPQIFKPFVFSGTVIFTSAVHYDNGVPPCQTNDVVCISWQQSRLGADPSQVGSPGGIPTFPNGYTVNPGQNIIATEVYFNYTPLLPITGQLIPALAGHKLYKIASYKPRTRNLGTLGL